MRGQLSSTSLDRFVSGLLEGKLPLNHDNSLDPSSGSLAAMTALAESRWTAAIEVSKAPLNIGSEVADISDKNSSRTVAAALYLSQDIRMAFTNQLNSVHSLPSEEYAVAMEAFLRTGGPEAAVQSQHLFSSLAKIVFGKRSSDAFHPATLRALNALIKAHPPGATEHVKVLIKETQSTKSVTGVVLDVALACVNADAVYMPVGIAVMERVLSWLVDVLGAESVPPKCKQVVHKFGMSVCCRPRLIVDIPQVYSSTVYQKSRCTWWNPFLLLPFGIIYTSIL